MWLILLFVFTEQEGGLGGLQNGWSNWDGRVEEERMRGLGKVKEDCYPTFVVREERGENGKILPL